MGEEIMARKIFTADEGARAGDAAFSKGALVFSLLILLMPISTLCAQTSAAPYLGRWDITLKTPQQELPSWIEVFAEQGQPKILMVGISDHAEPLPQVQIKGGEIEFLSPKGAEGFSEDMVFKGKRVGGQLVGTATGSSGTRWPWIGRRAPSLKRTGAPQWGKPITLFNGKDFTGWRFSDPSRAGTWKVEGGTLVSHGQGLKSSPLPSLKISNCIWSLTVARNPIAECICEAAMRCRSKPTPCRSRPVTIRAGSTDSWRPTPELPRKPGEWQTFDITLLGRIVTVVQDGQTIIDHQEIPGITGGALDSHEELPGPIYLQGSEEGRVAFRNIVITPAQK